MITPLDKFPPLSTSRQVNPIPVKKRISSQHAVSLQRTSSVFHLLTSSQADDSDVMEEWVAGMWMSRTNLARVHPLTVRLNILSI